jgi:hypothetical protein
LRRGVFFRKLRLMNPTCPTRIPTIAALRGRWR